MDFRPLEQQVEAAAQKYSALTQLLRDVTVLVWLDQDVLVVRAGNGEQHDFPLRLHESSEGTFYVENDASARPWRQADLAKGELWTRMATSSGPVWVNAAGLGAAHAGAVQIFFRGSLKAGSARLHELLANQKTVWRVVRTIKRSTADPKPPAKDEFPLRLYPELTAAQVAEVKNDPQYDGKEPTVVEGPGFGSSTYWPGHDYDPPLAFRYHGYLRGQFLVSRRFAGVKTEFFYLVPYDAIASYLQSYIIDTVAKNTAGMAIFMQIVMDVAIGFMPIVGPLYNFFQAAKGAYDAYKNWDKLSGWEKALAGLDVLTAALDIPKIAGAAKGVATLAKNRKTLTALGMAKKDATSLLVASTVLGDSAAARKVVEELSTTLKTGGHLTTREVVKVEKIVGEMVKKLPAGERLLTEARFATRDLATAEKFFHGLALTERSLEGLRRLKPEALVAIKGLAKEARTSLAMRYVRWAQVPELAAGMNQISDVARPAHVAELLAALGEDTVRALGEGDFRIPLDLAEQVAKQSRSSKAYAVLMRGAKTKTGTIPGIRTHLERLRTLPDHLRPIQERFERVFLSSRQLERLAKLDASTLARLTDRAVADSQLREIAAIAGHGDAAAAINRLAAGTKRLRPEVFAGMVERLGKGMLDFAGKNGLAIAPELLAKMKQDSFHAAWLLLRGGGPGKLAGWLDHIAEKVPSKSGLDDLLGTIEHPQVRGAVFARWAITHADQIPGVSVVIKLRNKAEANLEKLHMTFGAGTAENVLLSLSKIGPESKGLKELIGDLAAGHEKAMGASLTLHYVTDNVPAGAIVAFEHKVSRRGKRPRVGREGFAMKAGAWDRLYDLHFGDKFYEFKYWTHVGGDMVDSAMDEFLRDILLHHHDGFQNLRWVFASNVAAYADTIKDMMVDTLRSSKTALLEAGIDAARLPQIEADLQRALSGWLVSFH